MKILITGGCGFVGSNLAIYFRNNRIGTKINSLDNLIPSVIEKTESERTSLLTLLLDATNVKLITYMFVGLTFRKLVDDVCLVCSGATCACVPVSGLEPMGRNELNLVYSPLFRYLSRTMVLY